ncbi:DUF1254 domain-containing protein [Flavihumibacter petaseus]|uniref:DUF1254 domain-containing protein n=1 Tax=Flavihumibacter petaseus NBRC 106054 TaxID=1220578 RepID=A0A0E9N0B4_9BACT|nr:DUF1254 domain-containing protein [Flavihumibacter petaseus]GAO43066.1 hypothetical protein FPE01S_02_01710 [Flavihumibacter petaseus NBRC 106054]
MFSLINSLNRMGKFPTFLVALAMLLMSLSCGSSPEKKADEAGTTDGVTSGTLDAASVELLKKAYLFGFPLVVMDASRQVMTNVTAPVTAGRLLAPVNQFANAQTFPDDKFRDVVRPNCDTYYSMGWLDLGSDAIVVELPATNDRYYLFPMLDAWTNVFFSPGTRTTGNKAQRYLVTGPGWSGTVPAGLEQVKAPTDIVWVIGRVQVNSAKDGATTVKKIQQGFKLVPLAAYGKPYTPVPGKVDPAVPKMAPNDIVTGMSATDYFNRLNALMVKNPPAAADAALLKELETLGIGPGKQFDAGKLSAALQDSLKALPGWGKNELSSHGMSHGKSENGWVVNRGLGDYGTNYPFRAGVSYGGLGANLDADAIYPASQVDGDGEPYDGSKHDYVLHFGKGQTPPSKAFWSLTLYDPEGFLSTNVLNRFAIGDRDPIKKNVDGSTDIYISKNKPSPDKTANWLPAPNGPFNLLLRVYWPKEDMISGSWKTPPVQKVK